MSAGSTPKNLGLLFRETVRRFPSKTAFKFKLSGRYVGFPWSEALGRVDAAASFFLSKGLKRGDRVAILSENRPEWTVIDLACQSIGVATVPIYTSLTANEIGYLLKDCGARWLAVSQKALFEKTAPVCRDTPLEGIVAFDGAVALSQGAVTVPIVVMSDVLNTARDSKLDGVVSDVPPDALASLIYTSGTTGVPKGVMLSHSNFIENCVRCRTALRMGESDRHLSFLPLSHVFERTAGYYLMVMIGAEIGYAEDLDSVPKNILETHPTFLLGVPRFYEKVRARVLEKVSAASSFRKGLFHWALDLGRKKRLGKLGPLGHLEHALASVLVYKKFRAGLGGRLRFGVSGGAPLAQELAEFFHDLGVLIVEGYGLSETSPVICCNREEKFRFGTVGLVLDGIGLRIAEDGEIQTSGPCVMTGYWNKPQETAEALKDGWFFTGDLGKIDADGFLTITGRKKELIVTSGGKKVSPRPIEELLENDPLITRCVLYGDCRKYLTALIVPDREALLQFARDSKIAFGEYADLLANKYVIERFEGCLRDRMKDFASYEKIKAFVLLENDFTQAAGELTPTLKVKRSVVLSRHAAALAALYPPEP